MIDLRRIKNDLSEFYADDLAIIRDNVKWEKDEDDVYCLKKNENYVLGLDFAYYNISKYLSKVFREEMHKLKEYDNEFIFKYDKLMKYTINKINEDSVSDAEFLCNIAKENIGNGSIMATIKYFDVDLVFDLVDISPSSEINSLLKSMRIDTENYFEPMLIIVYDIIYNEKIIEVLNKNKGNNIEVDPNNY